MNVIARQGVRVPMETGVRRYVTDTAVVDVPNTVYYRRRIAEGDLLTGDDAAKALAAAKAPEPASVEAQASAQSSEVAATDTSAVPAGDKKSAKGA